MFCWLQKQFPNIFLLKTNNFISSWGRLVCIKSNTILTQIRLGYLWSYLDWGGGQIDHTHFPTPALFFSHNIFNNNDTFAGMSYSNILTEKHLCLHRYSLDEAIFSRSHLTKFMIF